MITINRSNIRNYLIMSLFNLNDTLYKIDRIIKNDYNNNTNNTNNNNKLKLQKLYDFLKEFEKEAERKRYNKDTNLNFFIDFVTGSGPICNGEYWGTYYSFKYNEKHINALLKKYNKFLQDDLFIGFTTNITKQTIKANHDRYHKTYLS